MAEKKRRGKGDGSLYQRSSDGRWIGVVDLGYVGGKRVRKTVSAATRKACAAKLKTAQRSIDDGVMPDDATVEQWLDYWVEAILPASSLAVRTCREYARVCKSYLKPTIGHYRLQALRPDHIRAMHKTLSDGTYRDKGKPLADSSIVAAHAVLTSALTAAWRESRIRDNVAKKAPPKRAAANHYASLTPAEARQLLNSIGGLDLLRVYCALALDLRQGEALGLRWEDVRDGSVWVLEQVQRIDGEWLRLPTKSKSSARVVGLPEPIAELFESQRILSGGQGYIFPGRKGPTEPRTAPGDYRRWVATLDAAGVPRIPLHGARATGATLMLEAGMSADIVAQVLGHSSAQITRDAYLRSSEHLSRTAIAAGLDHLAGLPALDAMLELPAS